LQACWIGDSGVLTDFCRDGASSEWQGNSGVRHYDSGCFQAAMQTVVMLCAGQNCGLLRRATKAARCLET